MSKLQEKELLQAALVLAAADGKITRAERGVIESLAQRAGVGSISLQAMIDQAVRNPSAREELLRTVQENAERSLKLLVGTARIDGKITTEERELLVQYAASLGLEGDRFEQVYQAGIEAADDLRTRRQA